MQQSKDLLHGSPLLLSVLGGVIGVTLFLLMYWQTSQDEDLNNMELRMREMVKQITEGDARTAESIAALLARADRKDERDQKMNDFIRGQILNHRHPIDKMDVVR